VLVLGLLPIDDEMFPGSTARFTDMNCQLRQLAVRFEAEFFDWGNVLPPADHHGLFYRDGFHPNLSGARLLARVLHEHLLGAMAI
jgi:hypothetical protein